jgi:hypothetical protein
VLHASDLLPSKIRNTFSQRALTVRDFVLSRTKTFQHSHLLWNYADEVLTFACRDCRSEFAESEQLGDILRVALLAYRKHST